MAFKGLMRRVAAIEGWCRPPGPVIVVELPNGARYVPRPGAREIALSRPDWPSWRRFRPGLDAPAGAEVRVVRADRLAEAAVEGLGHIPAGPLPDSPGGPADPWDRSID